MINNKKMSKGITLIALVVTIIVLLILAGISVQMLTGDNGILNRAGDAKEESDEATIKEKVKLAYLEALTEGEGKVTEITLTHALDKEFGSGKYILSEDLDKVTIGKKDYGFDGTVSPTITKIAPSIIDEPNSNITFSTAYGTVEIIWLSGISNKVSDTPNAPVLTQGNNSMIPVTWTYYENGIEENGKTVHWKEDTTANEIWYNYSPLSTREKNGKTTDNITSMWANAKTLNGSYFVWIPRFAYRITYYSKDTSTEPTGYYDGYGMWKADGGIVKYPLDIGVETISYNGKKYIVHPAFTNDSDEIKNSTNEIKKAKYDLGGWDSELSGFWFAKYEMSGSSYSSLKSIPNVQSKRSQSIGVEYLWGRQATYGFTGNSETLTSNGISYRYTSYMYSHLVKNSEWGAVAYLTHSQYGRNGNEIDVNSSTTYITGNGGGMTGGSASTDSGSQNSYNTKIGAKASTTGNVYGIYDMSGGTWERVAAFYGEGNKSYTESSSYGFSMTQQSKSSSGNFESTKYITKYGGSTSSYGNDVIYKYGKIGDSTKEVYKGGNYTTTGTYYSNWFADDSNLARYENPFFVRGGYGDYLTSGGVFGSGYKQGSGDSKHSFRTVLCP